MRYAYYPICMPSICCQRLVHSHHLNQWQSNENGKGELIKSWVVTALSHSRQKKGLERASICARVCQKSPGKSVSYIHGFGSSWLLDPGRSWLCNYRLSSSLQHHHFKVERSNFSHPFYLWMEKFHLPSEFHHSTLQMFSFPFLSKFLNCKIREEERERNGKVVRWRIFLKL